MCGRGVLFFKKAPLSPIPPHPEKIWEKRGNVVNIMLVGRGIGAAVCFAGGETPPLQQDNDVIHCAHAASLRHSLRCTF